MNEDLNFRCIFIDAAEVMMGGDGCNVGINQCALFGCPKNYHVQFKFFDSSTPNDIFLPVPPGEYIYIV